MILAAAPRPLTILFVDENTIEINPFRRLLEARGHQVAQSKSAHAAYDDLMGGATYDLVVVDIMLAPGNGTSDRFSSSNTDRRMETGITLVESLISDGCPLPISRLAFFTHVERERTLAKTRRLETEHSILTWQKSDFIDEPIEFIAALEKHALREDDEEGE